MKFQEQFTKETKLTRFSGGYVSSYPIEYTEWLERKLTKITKTALKSINKALDNTHTIQNLIEDAEEEL